MDRPYTDREGAKLNEVMLDFEQRQRANALVGAILADPDMAAFEIIDLRDKAKAAPDLAEALEEMRKEIEVLVADRERL